MQQLTYYQEVEETCSLILKSFLWLSISYHFHFKVLSRPKPSIAMEPHVSRTDSHSIFYHKFAHLQALPCKQAKSTTNCTNPVSAVASIFCNGLPEKVRKISILLSFCQLYKPKLFW